MSQTLNKTLAAQVALDDHYLDHLLVLIANLGRPESCGEIAARLGPLASDLTRIAEGRDPRDEVLARAPVLTNWSYFSDPGGVRLMGLVAGHPSAGPGPILTSILFAIDPQLKWARTLSRFYVLGDYARPFDPNESGPH